MKKIIAIGSIALAGAALSAWMLTHQFIPGPDLVDNVDLIPLEPDAGGLLTTQHPLSIQYLRSLDFPGSQLVIEQKLSSTSTYTRAIVSYKSEGLKQFALLTVPIRTPPESGWPAIVFNHGYIRPAEYRTTARYERYVDAFASRGYVVLKPDYRGHGNSEGEPAGGYSSADYTVDVLNGLASLARFESVNPERIGMWGHSMGGSITQRAMVISPDIKVGVIWAGVVGSYPDLLAVWRPYWARQGRPSPAPDPDSRHRHWRTAFVEEYGTPEENPEFWNSISSTTYLADISGPIQLHHATADTSVPHELSESLHRKTIAAGKHSELFIYDGDDHNITQNFSLAMSRSVEFFDRYLKP